MTSLRDVAEIIAKAAKGTVHDAMKARSRPSPWEVTETWLKIRVVESLYESGFRVFDELHASAITNIDIDKEWRDQWGERDHPFDVSVLHPVEDGKPWAPQNYAALGLIELKKLSQPNWKKLFTDMELLGKAVRRKDDSRPLMWTVFVVFVNGRTPEAVDSKMNVILGEGCKRGLSLSFVAGQPERAPQMCGDKEVGDLYFQIVCLMKEFA